MTFEAAFVANTRIRRSPFTPRLEAAGVRAYSVYNRRALPVVFHSLEEDYLHLRQHVQVWDVSGERQVQIAGPDAARFVQMLTPRDLSRAVPGRCFYAPLIDQHAGMINDPVVLKLNDDRFWLSIADSDVYLWASGLAYGLGLDVQVHELEVTPLAIQGPRADALMARIFGTAANDIRFFRFEYLEFQGHPMLVARSGWSRQGGFEIYLDRPELGLPLWDAFMTAGEDLQVRPGCPNLIERIEAGLLSYGGDMTRENNPLECGLQRYCSLDAPIDYIGRDALLEIAREGPQRRLMGLRIHTTELPRCVTRWPVYADGNPVGHVSSATVSPGLGCGIGIAMLDRDYWEPGRQVEVHSGIVPYQAVVCSLPFDVPPLSA